MFSEYLKNNYDLDEQIEIAMEAYDGKSVSRDVYAYETTSMRVYYGYYSLKYGCIKYRSVVMDSDEEYYIRVGICLVNDDEPEKLGLTYIDIRDANDVSTQIAMIGR